MKLMLGRLSLFRAGDIGTIPFESQSLPALCPHPQVRRGAPRRARHSLGGLPTLAVRHSSLLNMQPTQCLQAAPSRRPVTGRSVRHWKKGTPVLSVMRCRALVTVADCSISMYLPQHGGATLQPVVNTLL